MNSMAEQLARARHNHGALTGKPVWDELTEAQRGRATDEALAYLDAAAAAGMAIATLGADELRQPSRVTATIRGVDDRQLDRDDYASHLRARSELGRTGERLAVLSDEESLAVAGLLDELAGVYRSEALGELAHELAVRIYDRLGI